MPAILHKTQASYPCYKSLLFFYEYTSRGDFDFTIESRTTMLIYRLALLDIWSCSATAPKIHFQGGIL